MSTHAHKRYTKPMSKKEKSHVYKSGEDPWHSNLKTEQDRTGCHFSIPQSTHRKLPQLFSTGRPGFIYRHNALSLRQLTDTEK